MNGTPTRIDLQNWRAPARRKGERGLVTFVLVVIIVAVATIVPVTSINTNPGATQHHNCGEHTAEEAASGAVEGAAAP